jgi:hypothetical protein
MRDGSRVRVVGPLADLVEGFRQDLEVRAHSPFTALNYLRLMGHLSRWPGTRRGGVLPLTASELDPRGPPALAPAAPSPRPWPGAPARGDRPPRRRPRW